MKSLPTRSRSSRANIANREIDFFPTEGTEKSQSKSIQRTGLARATGLTIRKGLSGTIAVCKYHRLMIISPLAAANGYSWADTLAHELFIRYLKKSRNKVPIWLHEGTPSLIQLANQTRASTLRKLRKALRRGGSRRRAYHIRTNASSSSCHQESAALFAEVFTMIDQPSPWRRRV